MVLKELILIYKFLINNKIYYINNKGKHKIMEYIKLK